MLKKLVVTTGFLTSPWWICILASLFPFYAFMQMNFLNTLGSHMVNDVGVNIKQIGVLSAGYIYADALFLLPAGLLLDRYTTRNCLLWGMSLVVIGSILFAGSEQFSMLLLARIISGIGHAFALLSCFRLVSYWLKAQHQGLAIGMVFTIALTGGLIAQAPVTILIAQIGWQKALWLNVLLGLAISFALWSSLPRDEVKKNHTWSSSLWSDLKAVSKSLQNWLCGFYISLLGTPLMIFGALWGITYLVSEKGLTNLEAAWITTIIFVGTILGGPLVGWLSDKLGRRKPLIVVGAFLSLLLMLGILNIQTSSIISYLLLFFILSVCASTQILGYPVVIESNPVSISSTAMGFVNVLVMLCIATLQMLFGWIWGSGGLKFYAIYLLALTLAISVLFSLFIKETLGNNT